MAECSDSYERLYEGQEKLMEFMNDSEVNLGIAQPQPQVEDLTPVFDNVMKFAHSDAFWNEVVGMEAEVNYS